MLEVTSPGFGVETLGVAFFARLQRRIHENFQKLTVIAGRPDPSHISTSFVERQNWTVRTTMRRYTRLSNGFSRKIENHMAAVAINYFAYNFIKIHASLRMSPAMAAGVTTRLFDVADCGAGASNLCGLRAAMFFAPSGAMVGGVIGGMIGARLDTRRLQQSNRTK